MIEVEKIFKKYEKEEDFWSKLFEYLDDFFENLHFNDDKEDLSLEEFINLFITSLILIEIKYNIRFPLFELETNITQKIIFHFSKTFNSGIVNNQDFVINNSSLNKNKSFAFLKNSINFKITDNFLKDKKLEKQSFSKFDKEDDILVNFIFAASNIRALTFNLKPQSRFKIKDVAGNIIPAIASTNAIIAAIQANEALKYLLNKENENFLNILKNPSYAKTKKIKSESSINYQKNPNCPVCSLELYTTNLEINLTIFTLGELVESICKKTLRFKNPIIFFGKSLLYEEEDIEDSYIENCDTIPNEELGENRSKNINQELKKSNSNENDNNNIIRKKQFERTLEELGVKNNAVFKIEEMDHSFDCDNLENNDVLRLVIIDNKNLENTFSIGDLSFYFNKKEEEERRKNEDKEKKLKDESLKMEIEKIKNQGFVDLNENYDINIIERDIIEELSNDENYVIEAKNSININNNFEEELKIKKLLGNKRNRNNE